MPAGGKDGGGHDATSWRQFEETASSRLDESGHPFLLGSAGGQTFEMGISRDTIAGEGGSAELRRGLLEAGLRQQLTRGRAPKISSDELHEDWRLLQEINSAGQREEASGRLEHRNQKAGINAD
jgi:hypothetical protein